MDSFFFRIKFYIVTLFRLFYSLLKGGEECVVCGRKSILLPLCSNCRSKEYRIELNTNRCKYCGKSLISTKDTCLECRENPVLSNADFAFPLFSYRLWNKELLFLWKMQSIRSLSLFFASKVNEVLRLYGVEFVVPVPPRKGKIAKNGWDQIDELCSMLKCFFGFSILNLLERTSEVQQKKLDRNERLKTIESAYRLKSEQKRIKVLKKTGGCLPEKVCIIDDVCTTGSTLECCCNLLKQLGIKQVGVITLFTVD